MVYKKMVRKKNIKNIKRMVMSYSCMYLHHTSCIGNISKCTGIFFPNFSKLIMW